MRHSIKLSAILIFSLVTYSCSMNKNLTDTGMTVVHLSDTVSVKEGTVIYSLPMTVFSIVVEMERTISLPGPYSKYAGDLLGLVDVITDEQEYWSIRDISVDSHEEADPSEYYVIETSDIFRTNVLALRREGLILDINPIMNRDMNADIQDWDTDPGRFRITDLGSDEYYVTDTDTAYRRVKVDDQFIRIPYLVETKKKLPENQLAERAARRLMDLRDGKHLILTGEANVFPQSDAAIIEMNRMEKEYTELFTGKSITEIKKFTYQFIPRREQAVKPVPLFRFSEVTGPSGLRSSGGSVVSVTLTPEQKTKGISVIPRNQPDPLTSQTDKLYYRIPDVVNLTLSADDEILYSSRKLISQFGEIMQLPANYIIGK